MKKITLIFAVVLAAMGSAYSQCASAPSGLVSWWPGEYNANDIIGGNNGVLVNGTSFTTGEVGAAFNLNGINNYVLINPATPSSLDVGQGAGMTFEGWINPATITQQQIIAEYERVLGSGSGADVGLDIVIQSSGYFYANIADTSNESHEISTPANALVAGVWQHVALTYDKPSGLATLYINGAVAAQMNFGSLTPQTSFTNLLLGARTYLASPSSPNTVYDGAMDEFSIYSRALSSSEVAAIYQAGSAGKCASAPIAPIITQQPTNLTVVVSNTASFSVTATGTALLTYQWSFSNTNLAGATNATLVLPNVQLAQAGNYSVLVSNVAGFTNSAIAVLTVQTPPPPPPPACDPPPTGIVAWWPGQNNASDIIGGNNGTLMNGTGFTANGEVGSAFNLNGVNNFVLVGASPSLSVGLQNGLTFEGWINPATLANTVELMEYERALATDNGSDVGVLFALHNTLLDGTPGPCLYANLADTSNQSHELVSPANLLTAGVWQHVALTYDRASGLAAIYMNGVPVTQTNLGSFVLQTSFTNVLLGARTTYGSVANPPNAYAGGLDEISFYNRALSSNEIAAIYQAGSAGKCTAAPIAPIITQQPTNLTVIVSNTASFSVTATGTALLTYQWSFSNTNLVGATNATLVLPNVQLAQAGNYSVLVSNVAGFTNSAIAVLTVQTPPPPPPPPACDPPPSGIVAWWPGQDNANDIIGGNNGVLINGTTFTTGEVGSAFNFNGVNNFVLINPATPSSLDVGQGAGLTFEGWIKPATVTQQQIIAEDERVLGSGDGADVGMDIVIQSSAYLYANLADTSNQSHEISAPVNSLVAGVWQHIALTYDKTSGLETLYINGTAAAQMSFGSFTPQTGFTNVLLGARTYLGSPSSPNTVYDGAMDEFSIYNRALSSNEVAAIYQAGSAGKCTPVPLAPIITQQPTNLTVVVSNTATFSVAATGTLPLMYQWSFSHTNLVGATNATLVLPNVQLAQAGNYSVLVSNVAGFTNSTIAVLTVQTPPPPPPPACDPPPTGIVAWWPGQNNANDIIGGNNGVLVNGTSFTTGEVGTAFNLNGINNYVLINPATPSSLDVGQGAGMTFEGWINPATITQQQIIAEYERVLGSGSGADVGLDIVIQSSGYFYANLADTSNESHEISTPVNALVAGVWQHVALTYDKPSGLATLYINGAVAAQMNFGSLTPQTSFTNLLLGARTYLASPSSPNTVYSGAIDEFSIYNRALSSNEVAAIYLAGGAGKCTPVPLAPIITQQPTNLTVVVSNTASFSVTATGTAPLTYQWSFSNTNLVGATNAVLVLPNVQLAQAGNYSVLVSNVAGFTNSAVAVLTVQTPPPPPPPSCDPPPSGIVAWWPGQDSANDIIGTNNGTFVGAVGYTNGEVGQGFVFNGYQQLVNVGNSPSLQLQNFTIEAWIKRSSASLVTGPGGNGTIFTYGAGGYGLFLGNDGTPALSLIGVTQIQPTVAITDTNFHHLAVTKTNSTVIFYIDGVAYTAPAFNQTFVFNTVAAIGGRGDNLDNSFLGVIDEVSVYNRALSSNEVAAIYQAGSTGKCTPVPLAPIITQQPTNLTVVVSNTATFSVAATGTALLTYQWSFSNTNLVGATNATLVLPSVQLAQAGNYSVLVSNVAGFTNSAIAVLTVQTPPPPPPPPACDPPPSGIVAWWPGQDSANDIIGTNNGTFVGAVGYTNGEVGQGFVFDSSQQAITVGNSPSLQLQNFTIEAWIKRSSTSAVSDPGGNGTIFTYGAGGYGLFLGNDGTPALSLIGVTQIQPTVAITDTNFHHLAVTKTNSTVIFYIDGVAYTAPAFNQTFVFNTVAAIGGRGDNLDNSFLGVIDEVSVYNRALSSNEVAAIYQAGSTGKCFAQTPETVFALAATNAMSGSIIAMPVLMNATGLENTFLASVGYDPTKLVLQNVQLGQATAGAYLEEVDTRTNAGLVGFAILLNSGSTMPAGTNQQVALLNFQALPVTSNTTVSLFFTNSPTLQQTYDNNFNLLPTLYAGATVTLLPAEYEADVYPRTNGDHQVTVQDWLEEGRMVAGLDTPANSDEFLRADCAPRGAPDGLLTVADWVQAGRYALGLDPLTLVTLPPESLVKSEPHGSQTPTRTLEIGTVSVPRGQTVNVPVWLVCYTNENAVGLTVSFNPNQLQVTDVILGSAMAGGRTNINYNQPGKLGIVVAMPPGASLPPGTNQLLVLQLTASPNASGVAALTLDSSLVQLQVVDNTANALAANYVSGAVILPPPPTLGTVIAGNGLQLTWPNTNGTFQVQSASTPAGPWANVSVSLITNGGNVTVTVTATNQQQYFRLVGQ